jgi:peroxiredoxin
LLTREQRQTTTILAVSVDGRKDLQKMVDKITQTDGRRPEYTFLSDPGHRVINRYGLWNPVGRGWPFPTSFVIDRAGRVRWKFTEVNYKIRPTNDMILRALAKVP